MSKFQKKVRRADGAIADHVHTLPNGELTSGMLDKPSKDRFGMHAHLYEHEEDTCESGPMHNDGDHTHTVLWLGEKVETSGPRAVPKKPGEKWQKMDSADRVTRQGGFWVVKADSGRIVMRSKDKLKCDSFAKEYHGK